MSTRACVAFPVDGDDIKWKGVYSHWDGYPSGLGKTIWDTLHRDYLNYPGKAGVQNDPEDHERSIQAFVDINIKGHSGGWSAFGEECYCHSIDFVKRDGLREDNWITSEDPDPLYIEWVYILDPKKKTLTILSGESNPDYKGGDFKQEVKKTKLGWWDYGHCQYRHKKVAEIDLLGDEPDWEKIGEEDEE